MFLKFNKKTRNLHWCDLTQAMPNLQKNFKIGCFLCRRNKRFFRLKYMALTQLEYGNFFEKNSFFSVTFSLENLTVSFILLERETNLLIPNPLRARTRTLAYNNNLLKTNVTLSKRRGFRLYTGFASAVRHLLCRAALKK
jgi:hypothetical protein